MQANNTSISECRHFFPPLFFEAWISGTLSKADALIRKYLPAADGCVSLTRIKLGFNNMSFLVSCGNGKEYVLRATKETWPKEKVLCERACIQLMRTMTSLPVPTILCSDADASEFGCRWILMEKMPGFIVSKTVPSAPEKWQYGKYVFGNYL